MNGQGKKIDLFTNRYSLSKTLQFSLIPVGKTLDNFTAMHLLESDEERNEKYKKAKELIDRYHRDYIEKVLSSDITLDKLKEYADTYYAIDSENKKEKIKELEAELRKSIAGQFTELDNIFSEKMITEVMPQFLKNEEDEEGLEVINSFSKFTTYFNGFNTNRKNMYTPEEKSTGIPYRCINDNLSKFLDNVKAFEKAKESLSGGTDLKTLNNDFTSICGTTINNMFTVDYFTSVLSQSGIDTYNKVIGGYTTSDGAKIKGINEYINLFNQQADKSHRLSYFKPLFKQILSEHKTISFIPTAFESDNELISAIFKAYNTNFDNEKVTSLKTTITKIKTLFNSFEEYSLDGIYISNGFALTNLSNDLFKSWFAIKELWIKDYDKKNNVKKIKDYEKYQEKRDKNFKSVKSFSLGYIQSLIDQSGYENISIYNYYKSTVDNLILNINEKYLSAEKLLSSHDDDCKNSLKKDDTSIALIKDFLGSIKALEALLKSLSETENGQIKNDLFYSIFTAEFNNLRSIDKLYDKVRNYITSKPYSKEKYRITFNCSSLLKEWKSKYSSHAAHIVIHNGNYYIIFMNKKLHDEDIENLRSGNDSEHIICIKQKT